jgi:hypothetical protein
MRKLGKRLITSARRTRMRFEAGHALKSHEPVDVDRSQRTRSRHVMPRQGRGRCHCP